jgi:hypothetical protein
MQDKSNDPDIDVIDKLDSILAGMKSSIERVESWKDTNHPSSKLPGTPNLNTLLSTYAAIKRHTAELDLFFQENEDIGWQALLAEGGV